VVKGMPMHQMNNCNIIELNIRLNTTIKLSFIKMDTDDVPEDITKIEDN
jgi:hypothetical protein